MDFSELGKIISYLIISFPVWPARVSILLHADQFVYNLGMALAPLLSGPFIFEDALVDEENGYRNITIADRKDHLLIPLMINAYVQSISKKENSFTGFFIGF